MNRTLELLIDIYNYSISDSITASALQNLIESKETLLIAIKNEIEKQNLLPEKYYEIRKEYLKLEYAINLDSAKDIFPNILEYAIWLVQKSINESDYCIKVDENDRVFKPYFTDYSLCSKKDRFIILEEEYNTYWSKLEQGDNFVFLRSCDGEYALISGNKYRAPENWDAPQTKTSLGKAISDSLHLKGNNVFQGIACPCCFPQSYFWYVTTISDPRKISFSNLWVNINYRRFLEDFKQLRRNAVVIANFRAENKPIGNLNILKYYTVSDDCVNFWDKESEALIARIINDFGHTDNLLYVVSAGPMSNPIIAALYRNNPNNCYIDFGSSIAPYYQENFSRPYMQKNSLFANKNCWMPNLKNVPFPEVTVILNLYKRPEALQYQLRAIEQQTLKPKEILLFHSLIQNNLYEINLSEEIKTHFTGIQTYAGDEGVWERFNFARKEASCELVCILDDDTIPGIRWLENCYIHMIQQDAIYVTRGICLNTDSNYPDNNYSVVGWEAPCNKPVQVDFGENAWFMTKKHLDTMFTDNAEWQKKYPNTGESIYLSYSNLKFDSVPTIVPPHYTFDQDFWGSIPQISSVFYGGTQARSNIRTNRTKLNSFITEVNNSGWIHLSEADNKYFEYIGESIIKQ